MQSLSTYRKHIVASFCGVLMAFFLATLGFAEEVGAKNQMDAWFAELADPGNADWARAESNIQLEWSKSGSPAFDLLLQRGRDAIAAGDYNLAIDILTGLTDQAPDFAEGWNARATAFYLAGRAGPAIADVQRVLALEPRHFGALSGLGLILQEIGRDKDALAAFRASLAIHPHQDGISQAADALEQDLSGTEL